MSEVILAVQLNVYVCVAYWLNSHSGGRPTPQASLCSTLLQNSAIIGNTTEGRAGRSLSLHCLSYICPLTLSAPSKRFGHQQGRGSNRALEHARKHEVDLPQVCCAAVSNVGHLKRNA